MTTTIMMSSQIESAIREMCSDAMLQAVSVLSEKYGFDEADANRFLSESDLKIVRKRGPSPKTTTEAKKNKSKSSEDKPKRSKTGYLLYGDSVRAEVKKQLQDSLGEGEKLKPTDIIREVAAKWKAESEEVRQEWNNKAKSPVTSDDESIPEIVSEVPKESVVEKPKVEKPKEEKPKEEKPKEEKPKVERKKVERKKVEKKVKSDSEDD